MAIQNRVPADYAERVYAGVLGKIIGVYLGRPFESWPNERIERELGEIWYYVNDKLNELLIVADDDISGTFTFLRALPDHGVTADLSAEKIGNTWLNYLIEGRTVLWWGGVGLSTEHTAYLRLKSGVSAPESGSMARNGQVVAEQIGAQIFIDGWGMVCPNDPETAVLLAGRAASVSHDGEAVYAAQVIAAMEAMAFGESRLPVLLRNAQTYIPPGSLIYQIIEDLVAWNTENGQDWRWCLRKIEAKYGYDTYGGNCHVVPNFAVIILGLLYGDNDFQKAQMVTNTAGWDTDCNAANVGCLMAIKNGLASINARVDFRGPVADRMYLPTADGGRCVTDAVQEAYRVVNIGRALRGQPPIQSAGGARFHFELPGSVQGFLPLDLPGERGVATVGNEQVKRVGEKGEALAEHALAIHYHHVGTGRAARVYTPTFLPPEAMTGGSYGMQCSPTLYSGQTLRARIVTLDTNDNFADITLAMRVYGDKDVVETIPLATQSFTPGDTHHFHVTVPDTGGRPICAVGIEIAGDAGSGTAYLDWLSWDATPTVNFRRPDGEPGKAWRTAWVNAASDFADWGLWEDNQFKLIQNTAEDGFALMGCREWQQYTLETEVYPHMADRIGVIVCGRGLRRYVALTLSPDGFARLVERYDDEVTVLDEVPMEWVLDLHYCVSVTTKRDGTITATVEPPDPTRDPVPLAAKIAPERAHGNIGLLVAAGHGQFGAVRVSPAA